MWKKLILSILFCAFVGFCASVTVGMEHDWGYELTKLISKSRGLDWFEFLLSIFMRGVEIPILTIGIYFGYARIYNKAPRWWRAFAFSPYIVLGVGYLLCNMNLQDFWEILQAVLNPDNWKGYATIFFGETADDATTRILVVLMVILQLYGAMFTGEFIYKKLATRTNPLKLIQPAVIAMFVVAAVSFIPDLSSHWEAELAVDVLCLATVAALTTINCRMTEFTRALSASVFATLPFTFFNFINLPVGQVFTEGIDSPSLITFAAIISITIGAIIGTQIVKAKFADAS